MNNINDIYKNIIEDIDLVIGEKNILDVLKERKLFIYWGTTPSALPNLNYFIPLMHLIKFIKNGCEIKILLADIHSYLDSCKTDFDLLTIRTDIHEKIIKMMISFLNTDYTEIKFVQGSSYQLSHSFTMDLYKFNSICTVSQVKKAGASAVIQKDDPLMTSLLYPSLQALDIEYLDCDVFLGDINQKDICILANKVMNKLGYKKRGFFLNELYDDLKNMEKISLLDNPEIVDKKIINVNKKTLFVFIDVIILEICKIKDIKFKIKDYLFIEIEEIQEKYINNYINLTDIKNSIIDFINDINKPIIEEFSNEYSRHLLTQAKYIL